MTAAGRGWARELLRVWFHELNGSDWFGGGPYIDALLRRRFARELHMLGSRPAGEFLSDPRIAQAAILLFDQVPRNIHRGSAKAFAHDPLARALTHSVIERGWLAHFTHSERQFVLMPLLHSEHIADQRLSVRLFAAHAPGALSFARSHWRMIARFGRFPHRNAALGRTTTPAEQRAIDSGFAW